MCCISTEKILHQGGSVDVLSALGGGGGRGGMGMIIVASHLSRLAGARMVTSFIISCLYFPRLNIL